MSAIGRLSAPWRKHGDVFWMRGLLRFARNDTSELVIARSGATKQSPTAKSVTDVRKSCTKIDLFAHG